MFFWGFFVILSSKKSNSPLKHFIKYVHSKVILLFLITKHNAEKF